jgi:hypothetical protein
VQGADIAVVFVSWQTESTASTVPNLAFRDERKALTYQMVHIHRPRSRETCDDMKEGTSNVRYGREEFELRKDEGGEVGAGDGCPDELKWLRLCVCA